MHAVLTRSEDPEVASASLHLVRDLMAEHDLRACQPRAYRVTTLRGRDERGALGDHVRRDFTAPSPGAKLVGDITYVRTWSGWLYLATVIDCHSRAVVGWSMAEHTRTSLVCHALSMAAATVDFPAGAVFHSDRGHAIHQRRVPGPLRRARRHRFGRADRRVLGQRPGRIVLRRP